MALRTMVAPISSWADVELKQYNNVVTLSIDKTHVLVYTNTTPFTNGTIIRVKEALYSGQMVVMERLITLQPADCAAWAVRY